MTRSRIVEAALVLAAAGAAACISFDIRRFPDPQDLVASFLFCKEVESADDLIRPAGETSEFAAADGRVISFASVRNDAAKTLVRDTGDIEVNAEAKNLEVVTAYDVLPLDPEKVGPGSWTTLLFIDGRLAARKSFTLSGDEGHTPRGSGT
jgi:hypothetical protein